jgi:hypothetical protein
MKAGRNPSAVSPSLDLPRRSSVPPFWHRPLRKGPPPTRSGRGFSCRRAFQTGSVSRHNLRLLQVRNSGLRARPKHHSYHQQGQKDQCRAKPRSCNDATGRSKHFERWSYPTE